MYTIKTYHKKVNESVPELTFKKTILVEQSSSKLPVISWILGESAGTKGHTWGTSQLSSVGFDITYIISIFLKIYFLVSSLLAWFPGLINTTVYNNFII